MGVRASWGAFPSGKAPCWQAWPWQPYFSLMASQRRPGFSREEPCRETPHSQSLQPGGLVGGGAALGVSQRPFAVGRPRWSVEGKPASLKRDLRAKAGSLGESEAARQALGTWSDRQGKGSHCSVSQVAQ